MKTTRYKSAVYAQLARIGKSMSSGPRLEILDLLSQGPRTVEAIATQVEQSVANTSRHLQVLRAARLVEANRSGTYMSYRLAGDDVATFLRTLRQLAESHLDELSEITRELRHSRGVVAAGGNADIDVEAVARETLITRVRRGEVTVLDVRPADEYDAGHLPGALSVPLDELELRLAELPPDRSVVAYCRGPYCVMALDAVDTLRAHGFDANSLDEGVADWRARGLSVVSEPSS